MCKTSILFLTAIILTTACAKTLDIPVMHDYTVYEVEVQELSGLCLSMDKASLLACGDKGVVKSLSFTGQATDLWAFASDMEGLTINPSDGDIYLSIEGKQEVHRLSAPDYHEQTVMFAVQEASGYKNNGLEAVEYFKDDILFVGSQQGANLWQYRIDGTRISMISLSAFASEIAGLCYDDESGYLWVADSKKAKIFMCTVEGKLLATYDIQYIDYAESVCVDRKHDCVWVGSDEDSSKIYRIEFDF